MDNHVAENVKNGFETNYVKFQQRKEATYSFYQGQIELPNRQLIVLIPTADPLTMNDVKKFISLLKPSLSIFIKTQASDDKVTSSITTPDKLISFNPKCSLDAADQTIRCYEVDSKLIEEISKFQDSNTQEMNFEATRISSLEYSDETSVEFCDATQVQGVHGLVVKEIRGSGINSRIPTFLFNFITKVVPMKLVQVFVPKL